MDDLERAKEVKDAEATVSSVDSTSDVEGQGSGDPLPVEHSQS